MEKVLFCFLLFISFSCSTSEPSDSVLEWDSRDVFCMFRNRSREFVGLNLIPKSRCPLFGRDLVLPCPSSGIASLFVLTSDDVKMKKITKLRDHVALDSWKSLANRPIKKGLYGRLLFRLYSDKKYFRVKVGEHLSKYLKL